MIALRHFGVVAACVVALTILAEAESDAFRIVEASRVARVEAGMRMPTDAAFGQDGSLYILDGYQGRIVVRNPVGGIRSLRPAGACALKRPLGIAVSHGKIYVANSGNGKICELDLDGGCLRELSISVEKKKSRFVPTDIAIEGGVAVVVDRGENLLHFCIYPAMECKSTTGDLGKEAGALNAPYLADMRSGRVFVSDMLNGRIVELSSSGGFLGDLSERGVREGRFIRPKGVAAGPGGRIYVSDSTLGVVQSFDEGLRYIGVVGHGDEPYVFQHPAGLAVHADLLAVVEEGGNAASLLRIGNR